jgi:hypothetical protein
LKAITGRDVFHFGEYNRLIIAENIVMAYHARQAASNWAEWSMSNPKQAELLAEATKLHAARITE